MKGMKKNFGVVLALLAMLGLLFAGRPLMAQGSVAAESTPSNSLPGTGAQITVNINIDVSKTSPAELLGSFSGSLKWNSTVLSFVSHSNLKGGFTGVVNAAGASNGVLEFNGANPSGAGGKLNVLTVTFNVIGASGARSTLDLEFSAMTAAVTFKNFLPILTIKDGAVLVGRPSLLVNPMSLHFTAQQGGVNPASQTFDIVNIGTGTMNWTVVDNQSWLSVHPTSGATTTEVEPVTVSVNIAGLVAGTYNGGITVTAPGASNSPKIVQISLTITPVVAGKVTARVACPIFDLAPNTSITFPILVNMTASPAPDDRLGSFTGSLKWDPAVLQLSSHSGLKSGFTGVVVSSGANFGQISFNGANVNGAAGNVNILEVTFRVIGPAGSSTTVDLGFSAMAAALTIKDLLPILTVNDCKVTVRQPTGPCNPNSCSGPALFPTPRGGALGQRLTARDGDTLFVDLRIKENAQPVDAFGFVVNVNPGQLSFVRALRGNLTASFTAVNANETPGQSGIVICGGFGTTPIPANSNGVLLTLAFAVKCQAIDSSLVTISNLTDDVAGFNACCNIFHCASCIEDGDVNDDGRLTPGDALCAFQIFINGGALPASCNTPGFTCELGAADVNCDGTITPGDALAIFNRYISGLPPMRCFAKTGLTRAAVTVAPYQLELKQQTITPISGNNEMLTFTLTVDNPAGLNAFGLQLAYPSAKLDFIGVERTALTAGWTQLHGKMNQPGVVTIGGFNQTALSANAPGELFEIVFAAKGPLTPPEAIWLSHLTDDFTHAAVKTNGFSAAYTAAAPAVFKLHQNYPNPIHIGLAQNETLIRFDLPGQEAVSVELAIYNLYGQMVRRLISGKRSPGAHEVTWDGKDEDGRLVASGTYLYRLKAAAFFETKRVTVVR